MSKILIIGGASGLGASLAASLLQRTQYNITTIDDLRVEPTLQNLQFAMSHKKGDRHRFHLTSLSDQHIAKRLFEIEKPDTIIFCKTPESTAYHQSLVQALCHAKSHKIRLLYIVPHSWSSERNESYSYGVEICRSESNIGISSILHTCRIYGPRQESGDPMIEAMGQIIAGKWPNMSHFSHAPEHWLYIKDLLTAIEYILASQNIENEYKVVPNRSSSEYDVITYLQKIGDGTRPAVIKEEITASTDSSSIYALGWNQKYALREALEHTLSWYAVNAWALNGSSYECK